MSEEITINLKDLLYRVLLRWRLIAVACVVCAVLANCIGVLKDMKAVKEAQNAGSVAEADAAEAELKTLKAALSSREAAEADAAVSLYNNLRKRYDNLSAYQRDSILYNIDAQKAPTVNMLYSVDSKFKAEYPVIAQKDYSPQLVDAFACSVKDEGLYTALAGQLGVDSCYLVELVEALGVGAETRESYDSLLVTIYGKDRQMCDAIADAVASGIESKKAELLSDYPGYELKAVSRSYREEYSNEIRLAKQQIITDANNMRSYWNSIQTSLNDAQKSYYNAVVDMEDREMALKAPEEAQPLPVVDYFHGRMVAIGFVLGGVLVFMLLAMMYVLMPVVRVKENITDGYSSPVLATVWPEPEKKPFLGCVDEWLTKVLYGGEYSYGWKKRVDMLCVSLKLLIEKQGIESLYLTGTSDKGKTLAADIIKGLGKGVKADCGDSVVHDEKSLQKLASAQAAVFVEVAGDSRYEDIAKELELAEQNQIKVLGFVLQQER